MWLCGIFAKITIKAKKRRIKGIPANPKTIGEHLRKVRLERGLLQKEVAEMLGVCVCVCEDTITGWENNRSKPQKKSEIKVQNFLREYLE